MNTPTDLTTHIVTVAKMILWEFGNEIAQQSTNLKLSISVHFLARSVRQMEAIQAVMDAGFVPDAYILYRSLLERYLLYTHLCQSKEFRVFDDWCFKKAYEVENRMRSSHDLKDKPALKVRVVSPGYRERYERVRSDELVRRWRRPDMEQIAKKLDLKFFYDAGYDHASSFVHPVSMDGLDDYLLLMERDDEVSDQAGREVLGNAQLTTLLHIHSFLNQPEYNWRRILYDLIECLMANSGGESRDYSVSLTKVAVLHESSAGLLRGEAGHDT